MTRKEKLIAIKAVASKYVDDHVINISCEEMEELTRWIMELCIKVYDRGYEQGTFDEKMSWLNQGHEG